MTSPRGAGTYDAARLQDAFASDPRVNELGLQVRIEERHVYITGDVATGERRTAVSSVAEELLPGYDIHNGTTVWESPGRPDVEELT